MHKILNANEVTVEQDLPYIANDNIDYYNFLESNYRLAMYINNLKNIYIH